MRCADHLDLEAVAHPGLLEVLAEQAVDQADRREVLDAGEAELPELAQEHGHEPERIGPADAGEHGRVPHDRQHLGRHLDDDRVRVAVGHHARQRAAAGHPVAPRVVDDDQVAAARLGALRGEAGAGAGADDRPALGHLGAQPLERLLPRHRRPCHSRYELVEAVRHRERELRVVDVEVELVELHRSARGAPAALRSGRSSAAGSWNAWPSTAIIETPLKRHEQRGRACAHGRASRAIRRPSSAHSSGVVRIRVTVGLWT